MSRAFSFKQFTVQQTRSAFKVGTDSVVLGAWAGVQDARQILDIGTGTGLLALLCAQRNSQAYIHALEKDEISAGEAALNFAASPRADRLKVEHGTLEDFSSPLAYDYLICNPPYFLQSLLPPDERKADARHAAGDWFSLLALKADRYATPGGTLGCIVPEEAFRVLNGAMTRQKWRLCRQQRLLPFPGGKKVRVLAEWNRTAAAPVLLPDLHVRDSRGEFDAAYRALTAPYYLQF